jgi:uncharacterized membrane protein (DUF4010 family)
MNLTLLHQIALATGLGLLVGLQRQWATREIAGIRTFPLITLLGLILTVLAQGYGGWLPAAGILSVVALMVIANVARWNAGDSAGTGITTEIAALVMYGVGAMLAMDLAAPAVVTTGLVAVLLHWKDPLHTFVKRIGESDFDAIVGFVLIAFVILPVLPNQDFGPYSVLNPFEIWLMVVLIVGISMAGYVAFKFFGTRAGAVVAGITGGLISSTATTVGYARRSRENPARSPAAALVVTLASVVVFGRVLVEIAVVAPDIFGETAPPLIAMGVLMLLIALVLLFRAPGEHDAEASDPEPPSDLKSAIVFGGLYVRRRRPFRPHRHGRDHAVHGPTGQGRRNRSRRGLAPDPGGIAEQPGVQKWSGRCPRPQTPSDSDLQRLRDRVGGWARPVVLLALLADGVRRVDPSPKRREIRSSICTYGKERP